MTTKSQVRKLYRGIRDGLDASERARMGALIANAVLNAAFLADGGPMMTYVSKGSEADTHEIISRSLAAGRGVYVPKASSQNGLEWIWLRELSDLKPGCFGVSTGLVRLPQSGRRLRDIPLNHRYCSLVVSWL